MQQASSFYFADLEAVAQLVQTEEEKNRIRQIANKLAKETMRGSVSAYWWLPLDSISYTGLDTALEDEAEKLYVSAFPYGAPHRNVISRATVNLTRLRKITQDLAGLFGLTLPVPI